MPHRRRKSIHRRPHHADGDAKEWSLDHSSASKDHSTTHTLKLSKALQASLSVGHPWVYRNHVPAQFIAETGSWVKVRAGATSVWGLWDDTTQIALRVYSRHGPLRDADVEYRIAAALAYRQSRLSHDTTAYRLINGEGDDLPGIVVDVYGSFAVVATYGAAVRTIVPMIVESLRRRLLPTGIVERNMTADENDEPRLNWIHGHAPPGDFSIEEYGARFFADLAQGHKTGLYLDQRENRRTIAGYVKGARVLNLFSYTGAFSVVAALAGAERVTSVDIAAPVMARAKDNFGLNRLDVAAHEFVVGDCLAYLKVQSTASERYDVVICDPPSMARSRLQLHDALGAYVRVNALGMRLVRPGGVYAASSCTAQVSPVAFREVLAQAARNAGRRAQIIHEAGHAWDHPINLGHPEGRYLKFLIMRMVDD